MVTEIWVYISSCKGLVSDSIQHGSVITWPVKCVMKLLIHFQTLTVQLLEFIYIYIQ